MILWHTFRLYIVVKIFFVLSRCGYCRWTAIAKKRYPVKQRELRKGTYKKKIEMFILLSILLLWLLGNIRIIDMHNISENQYEYRSYDYQPPRQPQQPTYGMQQAYTTLGLTASATDDEIKKAYRKMAMQYHPDRQVNASETEQKWAAEKFRAVQKAYEHIKQQRNIK